MTRSVEIPDDAVWVASRAYNEFARERPSHPDAMHAALLAALPYLAPAGPEYNATHPVGRRSVPGIHHAEDCPMRVGLVTTGCFCGREGERESAPAGDGGLREALEKLVDEWDKLPCVSGYKIPNDADDDSQCLSCAAVDLRGMLAAHPATPAVPQPVDREALDEALNICDTYERMGMGSASDFDKGGQRAAHDIGLALRKVLAVLAGEQEQVER